MLDKFLANKYSIFHTRTVGIKERMKNMADKINIYVDNAATTAVYPEVFDSMKPYFTELYGNPASIYTFAGTAKKAIEESREQIAGFLGADSSEIYFTGGGSESDNWAIKAAA